MKKGNFRLATACIALAFFTMGCNEPAGDTGDTGISKTIEAAEPNMENVKAEIQALETRWAEADNARDVNAILAFYAEDAVIMSDDMATISGKAAIQKDIEESLAKKAQRDSVTYEVVEVFGDENVVTEVGRYTSKNAGGKVVSTGRYMAVWERRDGKFICIRELNNSEAKE